MPILQETAETHTVRVLLLLGRQSAEQVGFDHEHELDENRFRENALVLA